MGKKKDRKRAAAIQGFSLAPKVSPGPRAGTAAWFGMTEEPVRWTEPVEEPVEEPVKEPVDELKAWSPYLGFDFTPRLAPKPFTIRGAQVFVDDSLGLDEVRLVDFRGPDLPTEQRSWEAPWKDEDSAGCPEFTLDTLPPLVAVEPEPEVRDSGVVFLVTRESPDGYTKTETVHRSMSSVVAFLGARSRESGVARTVIRRLEIEQG